MNVLEIRETELPLVKCHPGFPHVDDLLGSIDHRRRTVCGREKQEADQNESEERARGGRLWTEQCGSSFRLTLNRLFRTKIERSIFHGENLQNSPTATS